MASRAVLIDPAQVPAEAQAASGQVSGQQDTLVALGLVAAGLLIESALLAGPAFAVIAQRQRRTLALAASNGATRAQLRRTMLAQALVGRVGSAAIAAALGVLLGWVGVLVYLRWRPTTVTGPFDVPWLQLAVVLGCAIVAAVVAALVPARGLGRLDVMSALRGDVAPRPSRRWLPVVGLVCAALGGIGIFAAVALARSGTHDSWVVLGSLIGSAVVLVIGALLAVPAILGLVGRLGGALPVPVRIAIRDAARQRGRATPTVAAIMAGTILLGTSAIAFASFTERQRSDYVASAPSGWLYARMFGGDVDVPAAVEQTIPGGAPTSSTGSRCRGRRPTPRRTMGGSCWPSLPGARRRRRSTCRATGPRPRASV
ncbi:FtsX-like permease family protein [Arsenicicoccus piscis]|uniref:ABC3 transporter permease C-terminal domain-containing protein n=1 Tax=Arsenicicoccus piscis TaxID=673954 RepID=A0ABQ6HQ15_9MICO|nr:FtsX-like permease family protein [Arsenicicoccus piscis]GMA20255.1 hypothetical protein GCM10025862_22760 [Arsenicicoccus piscis]